LSSENYVVGELDAEVNGVVAGVRVPERLFCLDASSKDVVSFLVGGAEELLALLDQYIPDDDGVFDCSVFLVE